MHSTLKLSESDPHDVFGIAPGIVPAAWADKVLADIKRDTASDLGSTAVMPATVRAPTAKVDTTLRTTATSDVKAQNIPDIQIPGDRPAGPPPGGSRVKSAITVFLFALCSAFAAAGWQHYGATAKQMIAVWTPPFALTSSQPPEPTGLAAPADAQISTQATTEDQAAPQPAPAQAAEAAAPAPTAPSSDATQLQSMARDLAAMGQEVELLKATVAELKSAQPSISQTKIPAVKPAAPNPQTRIPAPPPRVAAVAPRRPMQAYPAQSYPAQTYPTQAYPPMQAAPPPSPQQLPPEPDGEPVIRPPMPLH